MDQPVTITFVPEQIITWLIIGLLAGFLASILVRGRRMSTLSSIIVGLAGGLVGGILVTLLGIQPPDFLSGMLQIRYFDIVIAFIGAVIVLIVAGFLFRRRF